MSGKELSEKKLSDSRMNTRKMVSDVGAFLQVAPKWTPRQQALAVRLYQMLVRGKPVAREALAREAGVSGGEVDEFLDRCGGLHYEDGESRIIAFGGLALPEMTHRFRVDGRTLYTWCAWDSLFIPVILQRTAEVESTCPVSKAPIRLRARPDGVAGLDPVETVVSMLIPEAGDFGENVLARFCHYVHFFASPELGREWAARREGILLRTPDEAHELGREFVQRLYGDLGLGGRVE